MTDTIKKNNKKSTNGKSTVSVIGVCLLVLFMGGIVFYLLQRDTKRQGVPESQEEAEGGTMNGGYVGELKVDLKSQGDTDEFGVAVLKSIDGKTFVSLALNGVPDDVVQPAHIHSGSCAQLGAIKYQLAGVSGVGTGPGGSETTLGVAFDQLLSELPLAINIHKSLEETGVSVACGDVMIDSKTSGFPTTKTVELKLEDFEEGIGIEAKKGDVLSVHYVGTLESGQKFDSSYDRGIPLEFLLGAGQVIKGWDFGLAGMKAGGKRRLIIPSELGYGEQGVANIIPPNSTLIFDVELVEIRGEAP